VTYLMSAVLGFVQGVAEFLPISSSGHLTLLQHFFGMEEPDNLFNILLHFATLLAVCVYYFQDVVEMIVEFFRGIAALFSRSPSRGNPPEARRLVLLIIVGTLPLFVVMLVKDYVEALGSNPVFVSCALLGTGCILFLSDRMGGGRKTARNATLKDVLLVGVAQGCATIPGLSRSGCTISAGMAVGFERNFAVRYSFLLSLPAVLGATLLEVKDVLAAEGGLADGVLPKYLLGMVIAGVVGYFAIRLVNLLAAKGKFGAFAYYCWAAGLVSLILILLKITFVSAPAV
jgi:undecaprenyl-diphosphatase